MFLLEETMAGFLRNAWYVAATPEEVGRQLLQRWIVGEPIVLYRTSAGNPVALEDRCPHRKAPLSMGKLVGDDIECGYHGLSFDCNGKCVAIPGQTSIPPRLNGRAYPTVEKYHWVWVWVGDPAKADPAQIPDLHWNTDPAYTPVRGYTHVKAHYQLVVDNLLDLSHETYLHRTSIGNDAVAHTPAQSRSEGNYVYVERMMPNTPPPPLFARVRGFTGNIDRSQKIRFEPPSTIVIDACGVPAGTNDMDRALRWFVLNAMTPETATSTHYFWGLARCFSHGDKDISAMLGAQIAKVFDEDRNLLEQQQMMIDTDPTQRPLLSTNQDGGLVAARRIVDNLMRQESASTH